MPMRHTPIESLNLFVDGGLTKASRQPVRSSAKGQHADIYPAYKIRATKAGRYPDEVEPRCLYSLYWITPLGGWLVTGGRDPAGC